LSQVRNIQHRTDQSPQRLQRVKLVSMFQFRSTRNLGCHCKSKFLL
jgi:hypothetical protein